MDPEFPASDDHYTPLHCAAREGHTEVSLSVYCNTHEEMMKGLTEWHKARTREVFSLSLTQSDYRHNV